MSNFACQIIFCVRVEVENAQREYDQKKFYTFQVHKNFMFAYRFCDKIKFFQIFEKKI